MINRYVVLVAGALAACSQPAEQKLDESRPVRVIKIDASSAPRIVEYAGEVRPRHEIRLSFRVGGKIVGRLVDVGSKVRAGQPLARLDASDLTLAAATAKAQMASLESDRKLAAADLTRFRELRAKNFISQAEFERRLSVHEAANARLAAAEAQFRQASNQAAYALLTADSAGIITAIEAEAGQVVAAGQPVMRLARHGEMEASFAVPESQRQLLASATAMTIELSALPGKTWQAKLRELAPMADPVTRTYAARASIAAADDALELGMSARIAVTAQESGTHIDVPVAALYARGDKPQVFVVSANATVEPRQVKLGGISGERVTIESGLASGDVIVAAGAALLRPGQRVRILQEK